MNWKRIKSFGNFHNSIELMNIYLNFMFKPTRFFHHIFIASSRCESASFIFLENNAMHNALTWIILSDVVHWNIWNTFFGATYYNFEKTLFYSKLVLQQNAPFRRSVILIVYILWHPLKHSLMYCTLTVSSITTFLLNELTKKDVQAGNDMFTIHNLSHFLCSSNWIGFLLLKCRCVWCIAGCCLVTALTDSLGAEFLTFYWHNKILSTLFA